MKMGGMALLIRTEDFFGRLCKTLMTLVCLWEGNCMNYETRVGGRLL